MNNKKVILVGFPNPIRMKNKEYVYTIRHLTSIENFSVCKLRTLTERL